jgi:hypothetical protein
VHTTLPPFALPPLSFPFRHLAALAGRAPIGGAREVALGCFLAALALPTTVRAPLTHCFEVTVEGTTADLAAGLAALAAAAAGYLDPGARGELDLLAARLTA